MRPGTPSGRAPKSTETSSAAELAADDSLHPRRSSDHREDRLGLADPFLPSDALEEPPFAGDDRRSPAFVRAEEEEGEATGQT